MISEGMRRDVCERVGSSWMGREAMIWEALKSGLWSKQGRRTGPFVLPTVILDIQPDFVAGARLDRSSRQVRRVAVRQLESGTLDPHVSRPNLIKKERVRRAVREVMETVGNGGGSMGVLLPDSSVRVAVLRFETLPSQREEAEAVVRWKMADLLPFPPEEARISFRLLSQGGDPVEVLGIALRNSIANEYEDVVDNSGARPVLILPATAALLPSLPARDGGSQILVHLCSGSITTVVSVGDSISIWRNRQLQGAAARGNGEILREISRVLATCHDRLKSEVDNLWIYTRPAGHTALEREIGEAARRPVQPITGTDLRADTLSADEKKLLENFGMTFSGLLGSQI